MTLGTTYDSKPALAGMGGMPRYDVVIDPDGPKPFWVEAFFDIPSAVSRADSEALALQKGTLVLVLDSANFFATVYTTHGTMRLN